MDAYVFLTLYAWYSFVHFCCLCFLKPSFWKSSTEDHAQIVKQFESRSVQQNIGPDLDQRFLQKLKAKVKPYFDTLVSWGKD